MDCEREAGESGVPLCPQLARADISAKEADSGFDVVDGARSRRRIAVR
jgi:hypothetical protein